MKMMNCPNCKRLTGFKRSLGFGTFFMVLLTFGLWLLVIPLYPMRCINCGLTRSSAVLQNIISWYRRGDTRTKVIATLGVLVLVLLLLVLHTRAPEPTAPVEAPQAQQPSTNAAQSIQKTMNEPKQESTLTSHQQRLVALREKREGIEMAIAIERDTIAKVLRDEGPQSVPEDEDERVQHLIQEKEAVDAAIKEEEQEGGSEPELSASAQQEFSEPISIKATDLLAAYGSDEKSASSHYENKKVAITGTLTGVFVPPPAVVLRMAEQGRSATAFVTMAGPPLSSPSEALLSSGIIAYSQNGSLFGEPEGLHLTEGESVTLVCTVSNGSESLSGEGYSIVLEDCQIPEPQSGEPRQAPTQTSASSKPSAAQSSAAVASILKAAELGDADAESKLGMMYHNGSGVRQDDVQAAYWWRKAAEQGNARGQNDLGMSYRDGRGVPRDDVQAINWLRRAVEQGYAMAQDNLGSSYYLGRGVPQDYAQAVYWFRKAAEQGYALAQDHLSVMYHNGQGVPQDYAEAYFWMVLAASGKIEGVKQEDVEKVRDKEASNLTPAELSQVQERVRKWLEDHPPKAP